MDVPSHPSDRPIPPVDLSRQYKNLQADIDAAVSAVLASGGYIGGELVADFEAEFAAYIGTAGCASCNSGTDALYLALKALDIGPGDEVVTTPFSFVATAQAIAAVGATPVFVDIDPRTFALDCNRVEAALSPRTKALLPVHLFGRPADLSCLGEIARARDLAIVEDCAQCTGATWQGKKCGSIGRVGCFSFFPTKNLGGCGDGGAITADDPELVARVRSLKNHGSRDRLSYNEIGINSRLDSLQAAILRVKLRALDGWNERRRILARRYQDFLASLEVKFVPDGRYPIAGVVLPAADPRGGGVWNQYTVRVVAKGDVRDSGFRDRLRQDLLETGVRTMVYYPLPLHLQPIHRHLGDRPGDFPVAEQAALTVLSLPIFPEMTDIQQEQVVLRFKDAIAKAVERESASGL